MPDPTRDDLIALRAQQCLDNLNCYRNEGHYCADDALDEIVKAMLDGARIVDAHRGDAANVQVVKQGRIDW